MKRSNIIAVILIIVIVSAVGVNIYRATHQGNTLEFDSRTITPNLWGAPKEEILTCELYLNENQTYGWSWDRTEPLKNPGDPFVRPIFPNVRIGADFGEKSNSNRFPLKAKDVQNLNLFADYKYLTLPTGEYNLAYQMYFSNTDRPGKDTTPVAEVMVWLQHTFPQPPDTYKGDYSDGNNVYELWSWVMADGREYYSFIMKNPAPFEAQHTVDARKLLNDLQLDPNLYLLGVHFGNEIVNGSGKIEIRKLTVSLNGNQI